MASTGKSTKDSKPLDRVRAVLVRHLRPGDRLTVALSGGIDSVVLTDILWRLAPKLRIELSALHVHHGLSFQADAWREFCSKLCDGYGIACAVAKVDVPRRNSVEGQARRLRYRAYANCDAPFVAVAHNRDDQAETVLMQLLRGAGVKGLSAMPEVRLLIDEAAGDAAQSRGRGVRRISRLSVAVLRPLLEVSRREILTYARQHRLTWVDDDSNDDTRYDRNFIRHRVLPLIAERYPAYGRALTRAGRHLSETMVILDEVAALDAAVTPHGLRLRRAHELSAARIKNALRAYIAQAGLSMPNTVRLDEFVRQLAVGGNDTNPVLDLGDHELRANRREFVIVRKLPPLPPNFVRRWQGESRLELPELGGTLKMRRCRGRGISLERLKLATVTIRIRKGGEKFKLDARRPRRSLKKLLQEAHVQQWQRARLPLIHVGEDLVCVPGVGVSPEFRAGPDEVGIEPRWSV